MNASEALENAVYAGKILLESGAEIYRVEETITRFALNCGMEDAEAFVLPTGIMVSVTHQGVTNSKIARIRGRSINLHKIDLVNALSREMMNIKYENKEIYNKLKSIDTEPHYNERLLLIASGFGALGHVLLFNWNSDDMLMAFLGGVIIYFTNRLSQYFKINFFISTLLAAFNGTLFQLIMHPFHHSTDNVIVCTLMLLVPGIVITNAVRDSVERDLGAALNRLLETVLIACAIALGSLLAIGLARVLS